MGSGRNMGCRQKVLRPSEVPEKMTARKKLKVRRAKRSAENLKMNMNRGLGQALLAMAGFGEGSTDKPRGDK